MKIIHLTLSLFVLTLFGGCSDMPSRDEVYRIIKEQTEWNKHETAFLAVAADSSLSSRPNFPLLNELESFGYLKKTVGFYEPLAVSGGAYKCNPKIRYPRQVSCAPHQFTLWYPTEKLATFMKKAEISGTGVISFAIAERGIDQVTGITKTGEGVYLVEYTTRWNWNEAGEIAMRHQKGGLPDSKTQWKTYIRRYDDGWRLVNN